MPLHEAHGSFHISYTIMLCWHFWTTVQESLASHPSHITRAPLSCHRLCCLQTKPWGGIRSLRSAGLGLFNCRQKKRQGVAEGRNAGWQTCHIFFFMTCKIPHPRGLNLNRSLPLLTGRAFAILGVRLLPWVAHGVFTGRSHSCGQRNISRNGAAQSQVLLISQKPVRKPSFQLGMIHALSFPALGACDSL